MSATSTSHFRIGLRDGLPFLLVVGPFGLLFGVFANEAGLSLGQIMAMTMTVIAGASQFTALQLMQDGAPLWLILAGALAVNLRMAMYSAALVPHLGSASLWQRLLIAYCNLDQSYAMASARYEREPGLSVQAKVGYFLGVATPLVPVWGLATLMGALVGARIPPAFALDFALPITFLAILGPMIRTRAHLTAALVSVAVGLALSGLPSGIGLLIAAVCAMVAGAAAETLEERRRTRRSAA